MKAWRLAIGLALVVGLATTICPGGEPDAKRSRLTELNTCCVPPPIGCCPDDYCRKPLPCLPCLPGYRTCDDYCRKPLPCLPCLAGCRTCDDYCRKPFPYLCWPVSCNYVCVASCGTCPSCQARKAGGLPVLEMAKRPISRPISPRPATGDTP